MKILLLGSRGQVGWELQRSLAPLGEVVALHRHSTPAADLAQPEALAGVVRAVSPQAIVNAAAYTAVDRAETERELAFTVNAAACAVLAREAAALGAWLVHYSTDYVFDGSGERPWQETDTTAPVNAYGASKLAGEHAIAQAGAQHLVLRTSWVYETWGQNFVKSMLRAARDRDSLRVVADQWGAPTRAALIADVTAHALARALHAPDASLSGIYHLAAAGATHWHAYACLAIEHARLAGMALRVAPDAIAAIPGTAYPTPARRPANSRLDTTKLRNTFGITLPAWEDGVRAVVSELVAQHL